MSNDLRTLAQAVVDAWSALCDGPHTGIEYLVLQQQSDDAQRDLTARLGIADTGAIDEVAERILAALDAERAQGYARAMGEVVAEVQTRTEAAVSSYYADRSSYREGYSDACDTLCELVQHMAQTRCD